VTFPLVALVILDGWGCAPPGPGNAVELANTPVFDRMWREFPHTTLVASGEAVGLPPGQMGNSEVGHLTIGTGRVLDQDLQRVNRAVASGALLELARRQGMEEQTWIHAFTDGRDVSPTSAVRDLAELPAERIATVCGRYYAMDRDGRWERTERALAALLAGNGEVADDPVAAVRASYERGVTDEFIEPIVLSGRPRIDPARDAAIFFNFRPDRARQLSVKLLAAGVDLTTMTRYRDDLDAPVAFAEQEVKETMAEVLAERGVRQLHVAETEKYAHVTYFFNGGREDEWTGETRILAPSPRDVPSYDHKPEMSAAEVAARFAEEIGRGYGFGIVNFANPDMVGHTGSIPAVVKAVETADACLGVVVEAVTAAGGVCLVTADHGNAEQMLEADGASPHTAHTMNPVPLILTATGFELAQGGELSDLIPTALFLLGYEQPSEMTGRVIANPT
jgi:2,3-bisphosphoglycerate-independent phosphoglycerate mutase